MPVIAPSSGLKFTGSTLCGKGCSGSHKDQFGTQHAPVRGIPGAQDGPDPAVLVPGAVLVGSGPARHRLSCSGGHMDQFDTPHAPVWGIPGTQDGPDRILVLAQHDNKLDMENHF